MVTAGAFWAAHTLNPCRADARDRTYFSVVAMSLSSKGVWKDR